MTPILRPLFALMLMAASAAAQNIDTRPYIFTQGHIGQTQKIMPGRAIQIQLPSNSGAGQGAPVVWVFDSTASTSVDLVATAIQPSPGRIEGFDQVSLFEFSNLDTGPLTISIRTEPENPFAKDGLYWIKLQTAE